MSNGVGDGIKVKICLVKIRQLSTEVGSVLSNRSRTLICISELVQITHDVFHLMEMLKKE